MADITMCNNKECKLADTCYRFKATACEHRQSYFSDSNLACEEDDYKYYWDMKHYK